MYKIFRAITLFLCIALISGFVPGALSSCKSDEDVITTTTVQIDNTATEADVVDARQKVSDELPDMDFGGASFKVLVRTGWESEFYADSEIGEVVNDAVYTRNRTVEDRFNVKIEVVPVEGGWDSQATFINAIRSSVSSGADEFNLIAGFEAYITPLASEGLFYNLHNCEYLNFDKPWWVNDLVDEFTVNDKLFFATGDLSLSLIQNIYVILFNKKMIEDFNIENPYDIVNSGNWTIDTLTRICKDVYSDINGDGQPNKEDLFGFATTIGNYIDPYHVSLDIPVTERDENGELTVTLKSSTRIIEAVEKINNLFWDTKGTIVDNEVIDQDPFYIDMFKQDRAMFITGYLDNAMALKDMTSDFGILPYPKFSVEQQEYKTIPWGRYSLLSIPASVSESSLEMTTIITEALAAESYKQVTPAYYEKALKNKYSRDEETKGMMDLIRGSLSFNFGFSHSFAIGIPTNILRLTIAGKNNDYVSRYEKVSGAVDTALEKLLEKYSELK